jgi:DnaJ like chaperone protein
MPVLLPPMPWHLISQGLSAATGDADPTAEQAPSSLVERLWRLLGLDRLLPTTPALNTVAFTIALISLSAKLAKADGVAVKIEAETFERLHRASPADLAHIRRLYDLAAQDSGGFQAYADKIAGLLVRNTTLLRDVLDGLFHIAIADGILHPEEERHLLVAAESFAISNADYRSMRALFVHDPNDPYAVLGLPPGVDAGALKARYKQLVRANHPDMQTARGVPKEFVDIATRKLASINAAYEQIQRDRGR